MIYNDIYILISLLKNEIIAEKKIVVKMGSSIRGRLDSRMVITVGYLVTCI